MIQELMFWFDDDPGRGAADKIVRAIERYRQKHGHGPDLCYVNPTLPNCPDEVGGVKVTATLSVLQHYFWLGMSNARQPAKSAKTQENFIAYEFTKPTTANQDYPTPDELTMARRMESAILLLGLEIKVDEQALRQEPPSRQQAIADELQAAIAHARKAQGLLRHEGD